MSNNKQRLELTWIGKNDPEYDIANIEPRILEEIPELSNCANDPNTENMIIHGDNLLALKALLPEWEGKVKCIYIDPPYNTGKAFDKYDDCVEHSTWLSLMKPRLELLKMLLREDGVIFVQIDDNEQIYLGSILLEVFGKQNYIACLPVVQNLKGNQDQYGFAGTHEYILVFAKNKNLFKFKEFQLNEEEIEEWDQDDIGFFKKGAPLRATGEESNREDRPSMFYPLLVKEDKIHLISDEEFQSLIKNGSFDDDYLNKLTTKYKNCGYDVVLPRVDENTFGRWRWGFLENKARFSYDVLINKSGGTITFYKKQRPAIGDLPSRKPKSLLYKPEYSSTNAKSESRKLFGGDYFDYPKAEQLLYDIIHISTNENDLVLDSFLGSATTIAVANKMKRRFIGVETGKQAYTHCKVRLDKVIEGNDDLRLSEALGWKGGGAYRFYELAPSFIIKDEFGNPVIDDFYSDTKLIKAMCKLMNFTFAPSTTEYWKHGIGQGKNYLYVTTQLLTSAMIQQIVARLGADESLIICPKKFEPGADKIDRRITIKKIPQSVLKACHFGNREYLLPIKESALDEVDQEDSENE
jgi:adenine-specific DNA-methyltransferase